MFELKVFDDNTCIMLLPYIYKDDKDDANTIREVALPYFVKQLTNVNFSFEDDEICSARMDNFTLAIYITRDWLPEYFLESVNKAFTDVVKDCIISCNDEHALSALKSQIPFSKVYYNSNPRLGDKFIIICPIVVKFMAPDFGFRSFDLTPLETCSYGHILSHGVARGSIKDVTEVYK